MSNSKKNSTFRNKMFEHSKRVERTVKEEALVSKFLLGSHNSKKLNWALALTNNLHLNDCTLLTEGIHKIHTNRLRDRYVKRYISIKNKVASFNKQHSSEIAFNRFRFLTVVDCVEVINHSKAIDAIQTFRNNLTETINQSVGIWCLGAIEVEVISIEMMRLLAMHSTDSEKRKLDVCETLLKSLSKRDQNLSSFFLIHFHGVVTGTKESRFIKFSENLHKNKKWKRAPRQIELKSLSRRYQGNAKAIERSLNDIARYITKGGNDWYGEKAYLRYKLGFDNEDIQTEDSWVNKNWRKNEILRKEHKEEGIEDMLSMNPYEISTLAQVIDTMMKSKRDLTGYLLLAKSSRTPTTEID